MELPADWELSNRVIGAAIDVHKQLGPGLLESIYEECLCWKLRSLEICFERQKFVPIIFEEVQFRNRFRIDLVVQRRIIVEVKSVETLVPLHKAQLMTYLRLTGLQSGLLINFNSHPLKTGIKRVEIPKRPPPFL
jgi:GxxExxY protein